MKAFFKSFGDLAKIQRGASPRPINKYIADQGINWIKIGDTNKDDKYIRSADEKITLEGSKKSRMVKKGDFLLSNSMSFGRPYILDIDGCIHDGWLSISDFEESFIPDFLFYLLSSSRVQKEFTRKASSGTVKNLNADIVRKVRLPKINFDTQNKIVEKLNSFVEIIDLLKTELALREKQFEFYLDKSISIQKDIQTYSLEDTILSLKTGLNPRKNFKLNDENANNYYITIKEIKNYQINPNKRTDMVTDLAMQLCLKRSDLKKEDVLFTATGTIGEVALVNENPKNWCTNESVYSIRCNKEIILPKYMLYYLSSPKVHKELLRKAKGGTVKSVHQNVLKKITMNLPNIKTQEIIIDYLDNFLSLIQKLRKEIELRQKQYEYYRDKLLDFSEETE